MFIPAFGSWSERDHVSEKQVRAIAAAQKSEITPQAVDADAQSAVFWGSGKEPYQTTLSSCTCGGFRGKAPCKHIYRLAMEIGIIDLPYKSGISRGELQQTQIAWQDAVAEIEKLPEAAQREIMEMLVSGSNALYDDPEIVKAFRGCPLLEEVSPFSGILRTLDSDYIDKIITESGIECILRKSASKAKRIEWIVENVPNLSELLPPYAEFGFISNFSKGRRHTMWYLQRKFWWMEALSEKGEWVQVPYCEINDAPEWRDQRCYFPDDGITKLLTKYGCNRCLHGFIPSVENGEAQKRDHMTCDCVEE